MMNKDTNKIIGKTIKSVDTTSINMWVLYFTDGSSVELWGENDGPLGLPQLYVDGYKPKFDEM